MKLAGPDTSESAEGEISPFPGIFISENTLWDSDQFFMDYPLYKHHHKHWKI